MTPISILHISDLHYGKLPGGKGSLFCHQWHDNGTDNFVSLCHQALNDTGIDPDFVVLCGDMVCSGSDPQQYEEAAKAVINLCKGFRKFKTPQDWARLLIVPGNHEVDRQESTHSLRFSKYVNYFLNTVYSEADDDTKQKRIPKPTPGLDFAPENLTWPRVAQINDYPLEFVFLYTPIIDHTMLLPSEIKEFLDSIPAAHLNDEQRETLKGLPWLYDRGFITANQLSALKTALSDVHDPKTNLRIALSHHNFFPICRKSTEGSQIAFPDTHLLSNGMEIVEQLIRKDVGVILHGHRHEKAIRLHSHENPNQALTIIGAPTAGLREAMSEGEVLGFNVVDILRNNLSWRCRVRNFQYMAENQILAFRHRSPDGKYSVQSIGHSDFVDVRKDPEPFELLTSLKGVEQLANLMEESATGPTILHFTVKANWFSSAIKTKEISPSAVDTPFYQVWGPLANETILRTALAHKLDIFHDSNDAKDFNLELEATMKDGMIAPGLVERLRRHTPKLSLRVLRRRPEDPFEKHILGNVRSWQKNTYTGQLDRRVNYAMEIYRLAIDPMFNVQKCIHICPVRIDPSKYGQRWIDASRIKFNWLLNSTFAFRGICNCSLSWMPFCFHERFNQTLVSIDSGVPINEEPRGVFVGWGSGEDRDGPIDEDLEDDHDYSVFQWYEGHSEREGIGALVRDIRGCLEKLIYPLSHRLSQDFPLLRDGKVFVDNLKHIARVCGFREEEEQIENYAQGSPQDMIVRTKIEEKQITDLFNWVLNHELMERLKESGAVMPWLRKDLDFALKGLI